MNRINFINKIKDKWWGMLLFSSIPIFIILAPFLFGGQIFFTDDLLTAYYPNYHLYKNLLEQGESILWNPQNFSGFPAFIGSMGFFSPFHYILFQLLPIFIAYNLIIFLDLTLALFFTWQLLKKFNLPSKIGFIGGLIYVFSQWSWIPDITIANAMPILPLLFLIIWKIKEKNNNWLVVFGGLLVGLGWLSVHFNWLLMILSAGFMFSLSLGWFSRKKWLIPLKFILMVLIGTFIGLIIIWPLLNYGALSARSGGLSYFQTVVGTLNFGDLLRYFLPYFKVSVFDIAVSPAQLYLGILPLFFLIFVLRFRSNLISFFSFLFFFCFLMSISYSPLFWILHQLPFFNSFRGPSRWMFVGSFAAAILACFGIKAFLEGEKDKWRKLLLKIFKLTSYTILFITISISLIFYFLKDKLILLAQNYFDKHFYVQTSGQSIEYYNRFIEGMFFEIQQLFNLLNPKVFLPIIFIFISYFVINYFSGNQEKVKYFFQTIALVVFLNFLSVFGFYHPTISKVEFSYQPKTVEFIKEKIIQGKHGQSQRIFSFLPGFSEYSKLTVPHHPDEFERFIFQSEILIPNFNLLYGLESANYYDNLVSRPMSRILALIGSDRATIGEKLSDLDATIEEKVEMFEQRKKILDFLGIRYIISVFPLNEEIFPKVFKTFIFPYNIPVSIYENKQARSLFYLADKVKMIKPSEEKACQKLLEESLEGKSIFIECLDCPEKLNVNGDGEIILKKRENNFIELETKSDSIQWLVFSENYLPGWRAYLDNKETKIYRVNSVYIGVLVLAGEHRILFKYNPYLSL
ncbi:MAG: YfhO family protein [Patescibacteria group bacterium]